MSDIQIFSNDNFGEVRTLEQGDQIWFVAKDVAEILDYSYTSTATRRLDEDEKGVQQLQTPGGWQEMTIVNEYGLYNLVLGSEKEEAKQFKRWITHEVVPSIRKTGNYSVEETPDVEDLIIKQAQSVKELKQKVDQQQEQIDETQDEVEDIRNTIIETDEDWRDWVNEKLNAIGYKTGHYQGIRQESYQVLEDRARCRLGVRLSNLKDRKRNQGASKTELNETCKLDVVEQDKRLKEIYTAIVKELAVKHSV